MEETPKPWLFRFQLEHTPSPNDPKGAAEFYQALGTMVVAFGRLEMHFLACVLSMLATEPTNKLAQKLPMAWAERERIWRDAFHSSPALVEHETAALSFLKDLNIVSENRNKLVHGLWETFNRGPPVSAGLFVMRHEKKSKNGVTTWRGNVSTDDIKQVAVDADKLNMDLQAFSALLTAGRRLIPSDVQIV
jgi:hypothetical protein